MVGSVVCRHGHGKEKETTAGHDVGCDERPAEESWPSLLSAVESGSGGEQLRLVRGGRVPPVLRSEDGPTESATGTVLPADAAGVLRGTGLGARDGVARGGLSGDPELPGFGN